MVSSITRQQEDAFKEIDELYLKSGLIKDIIQQIDLVREDAKRSGYTNDPECIFVTGESDAGKTTLISHYESLNPRVDEGIFTRVPVLSAKLPDSTHPKPIPKKLLRRLEGDENADVRKGDKDDLTETLRCQMNKAEVELVILDEFQHFIETASRTVIHKNGNWLKTFIDETKRPVVLFGMPWSVEILNTNIQLSNRFGPRFSLDTFTKDTFDDFAGFVLRLEKRLPFEGKGYLTSPSEKVFRLFAACSGNIGSLMKHVIRPAAKQAVRKNLQSIPDDLLFQSCQNRMGVLKLTANPFQGNITNVVARQCIAPSRWQTPQRRGDECVVEAKYSKLTISDVFSRR